MLKMQMYSNISLINVISEGSYMPDTPWGAPRNGADFDYLVALLSSSIGGGVRATVKMNWVLRQDGAKVIQCGSSSFARQL